ncbi:hypothetical protein ML462_07125 [Gramella lutea]|uniref:Outer membrane protein beta-barrel domain-containing protein n=1 Tax=Christiangramia lutea TaxID=1607951 RepID=A0A9X2ABB0_9FLAO|nr:hypothetical protein [Christiangramia lutea]MCH4822943.1 hypothetical protein [Christiangramia lutea]
MKKLLGFVIFVFLTSYTIRAQGINISIQGGYVFDDSFDSYFDFNEFYEGKIEGGLQWGVGLEYMFRPDYGLEITYLRQDTDGPTSYFRRNDSSIRYTNFDLGINYIMLGGNRYFNFSNNSLVGFAGLMAGIVAVSAENPENGMSGDATKFSWGAKLGVIYWFSDIIGFKIQTDLKSAVQAMGGGLYFGTGGADVGLTSYSTIYQFGIAGGIVFKIDQ